MLSDAITCLFVSLADNVSFPNMITKLSKEKQALQYQADPKIDCQTESYTGPLKASETKRHVTYTGAIEAKRGNLPSVSQFFGPLDIVRPVSPSTASLSY